MQCLNCDAQIADACRFCAACGQRTDTTRLTTRDTVHQLLHSFVDVERSAAAFLAALVIRPGTVAREYVDGKRRRYFGPFATLAVTVGITVLSVKLSGFGMLARDGISSASARFLDQHFDWLLLAQLPLLGGIGTLLFKSARLTFPEHMVLTAYLLSMRAIVLALVLPFSLVTRTNAPTLGGVVMFWAAWYIYYGWGSSQFYPGPRLVSAVKGVLAAAAGHGAIMAIIYGGAMLFVVADAALAAWRSPV